MYILPNGLMCALYHINHEIIANFIVETQATILQYCHLIWGH